MNTSLSQAKKTIVIGAAGLLGHAVVEKGLDAGNAVCAFARNTASLDFGSEVERMSGDAADKDSLKRAIAGRDVVFYCVNPPLTDWTAKNVSYVQNVLDVCRETGAKVVFPANVWVFGKGRPSDKIDESRPLTPCSKKGEVRVGQESAIKNSGARYTIVRLTELYGPHVANGFLDVPFKNALAGKTILWLGGHLDVEVEFTYIEDAAAAMVEAGTADGTDGETFHVPGSAVITPRRFLTTITEMAGKGSKVRNVPNFLIRMSTPFVPMAAEFYDIVHLWSDPVLLDGTKYAARFGQIPRTSYDEGIRRTLDWFASRSA